MPNLTNVQSAALQLSMGARSAADLNRPILAAMCGSNVTEPFGNSCHGGTAESTSDSHVP